MKSTQGEERPRAGPQLDLLASRVSESEIRRLFDGYLSVMNSIQTRSVELPPGEYAIYSGKNAEGRYEVLYSASALLAPQKTWAPSQAEVAFHTAIFQAVADSGAAGAAVKSEFDETADKALFGRILARRWQMLVLQSISRSRDQIAWIHATIRLGTTRAEVEVILASHNLRFATDERIPQVRFRLADPFAAGGPGIAVNFSFDDTGRLVNIRDSDETLFASF